uniref:Transmembrane protein 144b n=1 Tax=Angiostrongylus cantonensis TaxID=6313 RepID=A0A0K0DHK9_ANGCA
LICIVLMATLRAGNAVQAIPWSFAAQFFLCVGGFVTSTVVHAALGFPALHGFAMVGGALWATANAFAIQIMNRLGMALSILVWNTLSCITTALQHKCYLPFLHQNHLEDYPGASDESLPYLFSFFIGVLCTSVFIFTVYSIVKRSDPWVNASAILPSMSAGAIFAVAMTSFVIAIDHLQAAVAYPICSMAPGLVVSLWSILYFREITGRRNLVLLSLAYGLTLVGVAFVTISKEVSLSG